MWQGIAAQTVQTYESYRALVIGAGFRVRSEEDLTAQWGVILAERFRMYTALRDEARSCRQPPGRRRVLQRLRAVRGSWFRQRQLGGVRMVAQKN